MAGEKKILVVGTGLQGKAVIHDLDRSPLVGEVVAADRDVESGRVFAAKNGLRKVRFLSLDATREQSVQNAIKESGADLVVCMLPVHFAPRIARAALDAELPYVSSNYAQTIMELDREARERGVTILPEMGMDPGIDLLLGQTAVAELDEVHGLYSYGAGLPEPECADNPLRYKITWTFAGVLIAYDRDGRLLRDGVETAVAGGDMFREETMHRADFPVAGELECYPNGDALRYRETFGLGKTVRNMGRFGMRYPGHCRFWQTLKDLGFLDETPLPGSGETMSPRQFLVRHLTPRLQFGPQERDVAIIRIRAWGLKDNRKLTITHDLLDYRDLETGLFAMNRTVGYTASVGAQLILSGAITKAGVLSPARDVPAREVLDQLQTRGMIVTMKEEFS